MSNVQVVKFPKISQSLIKARWDMNKEDANKSLCGLLFKAKYVDKNPLADTPPSEAMKAGIYFEFLCTGSLPKSGITPIPETNTKGALLAPYQRAKESAELFKKIVKDFDITILKTGYYLTDGVNDGVIDILAEWNGQKVIIDLKYSGLVDDKWSEMGWHLGDLASKHKLLVQGVHYKMLAKKVLGIDDIPFYYFVFNSMNPKDVRIIKQVSDEVNTQIHLNEIQNAINSVSHGIRYGFQASPSYLKCKECPINENCQYKSTLPEINEVLY